MDKLYRWVRAGGLSAKCDSDFVSADCTYVSSTEGILLKGDPSA